MAEAAPYRPGWQFKDGKLLMFGKGGVTVLRGWPQPMAWRRRGGGPWRHVRPSLNMGEIEFTASGEQLRLVERRIREEMRLAEAGQLELLLVPEEKQRVLRGLETRQRAAQDFLETVPEAVRAAVARFRSRQWHVLALLARCPGADDLLESCPALGYALASNWVFHEPAVKRPLRAARRLVRLPRPVALQWLGFPGTRSAARRMATIAPREVTIAMLLDLRRALHDPAARELLGHLPTLRHDVIRLVQTPELRPYISPRLLHEWIAAPRAWRGARLYVTIRDTLAMAGQAGARVPRFLSLDQVTRHHNELTDRTNLGSLAYYLDLELPPPPIPGTETIAPLTVPAAVVEEGRLMHHCGASYVPRIARGHSYLYRVLAPERATLEVRMGRRGWELAQIQGLGNARVAWSTRAAVEAWLDEAQPKRRRVQFDDVPF